MENKRNQRLFGMIGFAMRAGKLTLGTPLVCAEMPKGKIKLVLVSSGASAATAKKLRTKSEFYNIPLISVDIETEELGKILGKSGALAAIAVKDERFAEEIKKAVSQPSGE